MSSFNSKIAGLGSASSQAIAPIISEKLLENMEQEQKNKQKEKQAKNVKNTGSSF